MGLRGPAATPNEIQKLRGNPGRRPLREQVELFEEWKAKRSPTWLSERAKAVWLKLIPQLLYVSGFLKDIDGNAVAAYCAEWAAYTELEEFVQREGRTYETETGYRRPRPEEKMAAEHLRTALAIGREFGFTPSARGRISFGFENDDGMADMLEGVMRAKIEANVLQIGPGEAAAV